MGNVDELIAQYRQEAEVFSLSPRPAVWEHIDREINPRKRRRPLFLLILLLGCLAALGFFAARRTGANPDTATAVNGTAKQAGSITAILKAAQTEQEQGKKKTDSIITLDKWSSKNTKSNIAYGKQHKGNMPAMTRLGIVADNVAVKDEDGERTDAGNAGIENAPIINRESIAAMQLASMRSVLLAAQLPDAGMAAAMPWAIDELCGRQQEFTEVDIIDKPLQAEQHTPTELYRLSPAPLVQGVASGVVGYSIRYAAMPRLPLTAHIEYELTSRNQNPLTSTADHPASYTRMHLQHLPQAVLVYQKVPAVRHTTLSKIAATLPPPARREDNEGCHEIERLTTTSVVPSHMSAPQPVLQPLIAASLPVFPQGIDHLSVYPILPETPSIQPRAAKPINVFAIAMPDLPVNNAGGESTEYTQVTRIKDDIAYLTILPMKQLPGFIMLMSPPATSMPAAPDTAAAQVVLTHRKRKAEDTSAAIKNKFGIAAMAGGARNIAGLAEAGEYQFIKHYRDSSDKQLSSLNYAVQARYTLSPRTGLLLGVGINKTGARIRSRQVVYDTDTLMQIGSGIGPSWVQQTSVLVRGNYDINDDSMRILSNSLTHATLTAGINYNFIYTRSFSLGMQPSVSYARLLRHSLYYYDSSSRAYALADEKQLRQSTITAGLGITAEYHFSRTLSLSLMPHYNRYLTQANRQAGNIKTHYSQLSMNAAITWWLR